MERWEQYLARDITHARQKALDSLDADLEAIKQKWTNRVNKQGMAVLRKSPQHYTALMEKDFQEAVLKAIGIFSSDLENRIVKPRFESPTTWDEIAEEIAVALGSKELQTTEVKKKTDGIFDPMMLLMGHRVARLLVLRWQAWCLFRAGRDRWCGLGDIQCWFPSNALRKTEPVDVDSGDYWYDEDVHQPSVGSGDCERPPSYRHPLPGAIADFY